MSWHVDLEEYEDLGFFRIYVTPPHGTRTDVTFLRGAPTQLDSYSFADPYGYATAQISFPQIGIVDDLGRGDLSWFDEFADVDIVFERPDGTQSVRWEGFLASFAWSHTEAGSQLQVTCQGALFQVDRYVSAPSYPNAPVAHERLIAEALDPVRHPHLRTRPLVIEWPDDWAILAYRSAGVTGLEASGKSTGFATRTTGGWEKSLTGFVSNLLSVMYTTDYADQWTIRCDAGRQPVMAIRYANRAPDFSLDAGMPGVEIALTRDFTQFANVLYGSGSTMDGAEWSRQSVSRDNQRTEYLPMAADARVLDPASPTFTPRIMRAETHVKFEDGMEVTDALKTSSLMLRRNQDPGYTGTITVKIDPFELDRYAITAGMTVQLRYFAGFGDSGLNLHVTEATVNVSDGSVSLTVDSKYRDALTVDEVRARTRDPLTPIRMLQIGKQSVLIPDQLAPWSYALGSGYAPKAAQPFFDSLRDASEVFPYERSALAYPPKANPSFYIPVNAAAAKRADRWTCVPIRLAEKGDIRLTQFALYDRDGNRLRIPFHVSLYKAMVFADEMPFDNDGPSPFIPGAFQSNNEWGLTIPAGTNGATLLPQEHLLIGWGDADQPAGYSPGTKTNGDPATGLLVDETSWPFDMTDLTDFQQNPDPGFTQLESAITAYVMVYAEYHDWVYAIGRIYRKEPGT